MDSRLFLGSAGRLVFHTVFGSLSVMVVYIWKKMDIVALATWEREMQGHGGERWKRKAKADVRMAPQNHMLRASSAGVTISNRIAVRPQKRHCVRKVFVQARGDADRDPASDRVRTR